MQFVFIFPGRFIHLERVLPLLFPFLLFFSRGIRLESMPCHAMAPANKKAPFLVGRERERDRCTFRALLGVGWMGWMDGWMGLYIPYCHKQGDEEREMRHQIGLWMDGWMDDLPLCWERDWPFAAAAPPPPLLLLR
jgi:hypothetical protein